MPSTLQDRPGITLYPSSQEEARTYMAVIPSTVRNSMNAQKASADSKEGPIDDDSSGRHHPNVKAPAPANSTAPKAFLTMYPTSSAPVTGNVTKSGFVLPRDSYPSPANSTDTGTWPLCKTNAPAAVAANLSTSAEIPTGAALEVEEEHHDHIPSSIYVPPSIPQIDIDAEEAAADTSTGVTIEAEEQNHGDLPPSIPPVGTNTEDSAADTHTSVMIEAPEEHHGGFPPIELLAAYALALPLELISGRAVPMPIGMNSDTLRAELEVPNDIPPRCQLYATNTDIHTPFAICPLTKHKIDLTHDLASQRLHSQDAPHSHILAIRNTAACEAPTDFHQRLVCGQYNGLFILGFFILYFIIRLVRILKLRKQMAHRLDEEKGGNT